jgi:large subunit ribosomal protein L4
MTLDIVNADNEKVGSFDLRDEVFGGRVKTDVIWQAVVREQANARRGTHKTKTRGLVSGTGKKPWRQKGTGRAQVGEARNPLWRHGGTVFGPVPHSHDRDIPRKVERSALRHALAQRLRDGAVVVVEALKVEGRTKAAAEMLSRLGAAQTTLVLDLQPNEDLARAVRNIAGVSFLASGRATARDFMASRRIIVTKAALERLQEVLG